MSHSLKKSYEQVGTGSQQMNMTGERFRKINEQMQIIGKSMQSMSEDFRTVGQIGVKMRESITTIAEESASGASKVSETMDRVSQTMLDFSSDAESLALKAHKLDRLTNNFKW
ncbi:hypothetical protein EWH99_03165 [Sporolactobacillus sp. THM7-7]|nr:hypothetical protein EWH99_03165 [Sporolactobacillus sp. THM7-7]